MINRLCVLLEKVPWLRNRFYQMKKRMYIYYPKEEEIVSRKAFFLCLKVWAVFLLGSIYFLLTIHGAEEICLVICIFYMAYKYVLSRNMERETRKLLRELSVFLGELRFQYSYYRNVEEALEECLDSSDSMMEIHGRLIKDCLEDDELEDRYISKAPVRFLTQLLILCKSSYLYGDCEKDGTCVFLSNVGLLKDAVEEELMKRRKIEYLFSGLLITCMLPIGSVPLIENWAIDNMQELEGYYYGTYGMVTTILLCILTILAYELVRHMQYDEPAIPITRQWIRKLAGVRWIKVCLNAQLNRNYNKTTEKHRVLKCCGIKENVREFLLLQYITGCLAFVIVLAGVIQYERIAKDQISMSEQVVSDSWNEEAELTAEVIPENSREEEPMPWIMWLFPIVGAVAGYHGRYGIVLLKKRYVGLRREEEILSFQMVILCLMYVDNMTGEEVLDWMEKIARHFRDSIEAVYYKLTYQNYEDTWEVRQLEKYVPMIMILEGVIACDKLPVKEAFHQMESDYHYTVKKYVQESEWYIRDKCSICKVLSFAPLYMTIGVKLIVPFVLEGIRQLSEYSQSMMQMM